MIHQRTVLHGQNQASPSQWFIGLDLGQASDFTALAAIERRPRPKQPAELVIQMLERWELGTSYPTIVEDVVALLDKPTRGDASVRPLRGCTLGIDNTGVGAAITDMFGKAKPPAKLTPVTITAGSKANFEDGTWRVPKADLVAVVNATLQTKRLSWDKRLPFDEILVKELTTFETRLTVAGNETFGSWREGAQDDLVLAVAIGVWLAERAQTGPTAKPISVNGMKGLHPGLLRPANGFHL